MAIMLLARSPKNRECDDAQIWVLKALADKLTSPQQVVDENPIIADKHTDRGKARLRNLAVARGTTYQQEADREFLEEGSLLFPHVQVDGNKWGREVAVMYNYDYEKNLRGFQPDAGQSPREAEIGAQLTEAKGKGDQLKLG